MANANAESPESRGERPRRGQERRYLTMEEAQRQFGDDPVSLPPQRSDETPETIERRGADRLAGAVCALIDRGALDARSEAGDALLDFASAKYGDQNPITCVRSVYEAIRSAETPAGARSGAGAEEAPFKSCDCDRLRERLAELRTVEKRIAATLNLVRDPYPFAPYFHPAEPKPIRCETVADAVEAYMRLAESEVTTLRAQLAEARKDTALEQVLAGMPEPPFGQYDERSTGTVHRLFRMEAARFVVRLRAALAAAHPTEENRA